MYGNSPFGSYTARTARSPASDYTNGSRLAISRDYGRYELEHLATFSNVNRKMRLPDDVLQQLRQLESAGQMFSMRIVLTITQQSLIVVHAQSGEIIEQFPMRCVFNPLSCSNRQNLLMFTCNVGETNEVHVFASATVPTTEIVDRIKLAKVEWTQVGRDEFEDGAIPLPSAVNSYGFSDYFSQPRPSATVSPVYPQRYNALLHNRNINDSLTEQAYQFRAMRDLQFRSEQNSTLPPAGYQPYTASQHARVQHNASEVHSQVLNWCFDDIEKFVGQLYRAMQAFRELERRVTARKQRVYMPGDGMLMRLARLPTDSELFEILQKFKFTLNLLGRLQPVLFKPNAADVVHKLMPFLRMVVDASDGPGQQPLAPSVISPLPTSDVVALLKHCLTSEETEFWRSLGDAWCISRDDWKGGVVDPYAPRFTNGYKLTSLEAEELVYGLSSTSNGHSHSHSLPNSPANGNTVPAATATSAATPIAFRLGALANQAAEEAQRRRTDELDYADGYSPRSRAIGSNNVNTSFAAPSPPAAAPAPAPASSTARALEKLEEMNQRYAAELRARGARAYEVTNEYTPKNTKEMSVLRGEVVEVLNDDRQWWKVRSATGQVGFCPCTILRPLDALPPRDYDEGARGLTRPSSLGNADGLLGHAIPPPPPPAPSMANGGAGMGSGSGAIYGDPRRLGMQLTTKPKGYY